MKSVPLIFLSGILWGTVSVFTLHTLEEKYNKLKSKK